MSMWFRGKRLDDPDPSFSLKPKGLSAEALSDLLAGLEAAGERYSNKCLALDSDYHHGAYVGIRRAVHLIHLAKMSDEQLADDA